ncbi:MAG: pilus assembly protein PilP [Methylococcales symbiont of Iophon sp. n. MRB-2018]|nr:MAG: pilus assembly protein PilP [Methylococcales symbiont of Iophon sp. n. MRB-2018]KAF3980017.1 MAG: pilus assembly protein PilP [Methylococcales symbiont of Iophon sp. n. MRB-2018]
MIKNLTHVFFCLLVFNLAGCANSDVSDLERYISEVKARPKGAIKPLPEIKIVEPFIFNPEGLRDPFSPVERLDETGDLEGVVANSGIRPDMSRKKEVLESYSLDTLKMVGTLTLNKVSWALVKASDGIIHRVQKGSYMGRNYGKISGITDNKIELMEIVTDKPGAWRKQQVSIALAESFKAEK